MSQKRARKNRAAAKKAAAAVFACSMVLSNVSMLPITAQETGEQVQQAETVIDGFEFHRNIHTGNGLLAASESCHASNQRLYSFFLSPGK